jgi:hypothetical protein
MSYLFDVFHGGLAGVIKTQIRSTSLEGAQRAASCNYKLNVLVVPALKESSRDEIAA